MKPARQAFALGVLVLGVSPGTAAQDIPFLEYARVDPAKVTTAEACGECHLAEYEVWKKSSHATSFRTLHRKSQAETIARKMGFRLIKRDSLCFSCHYTPILDDGQIRVASGPSCESCHGAGADWIEIHNDYGSATSFDGESAEHRRSRIDASRAAGMRRPSDLYPVVANCFSCHTVPNEELVNVGGHTTGSAGFEFVEWSQERIRHNFLAGLRAGQQGANSERPIERKRTMFVVGRALDLEYSLRGLAVARTDGVYAKAMIRRVRSAVSEVRAIGQTAPIPEIDRMLAAVREVEVVPRNGAALLSAAEAIGRATRGFLAREETLAYAELDLLLSGTAKFAETESEPGAVVAASSGESEGGSAGQRGSTAAGRGSEPAPASPAARAQGIVGEFKRRIRPVSKYPTIGPGSCAGCHNAQNEWWFGHPHYRSADPFFDGDRDTLRIARLYGISPSAVTRGDSVCMDCHGTIISGKEGRDVLDGVSCESCHGAAGQWLEPHKDETDKHLGVSRPGYVKAARLGKLALENLDVRARTCAGCHYITEPRLLSAGHPSGKSFDYAAGMASVRHWDHAPASQADLMASYRAVVAARGPVPAVARAVLAASDDEAAGDGAGGSALGRGRPRRGSRDDRPTVLALRPPPPRPRDPGKSVDAGLAGSLPPFPEVETVSIERALLLLKERLAVLYGLVSSGDGGSE